MQLGLTSLFASCACIHAAFAQTVYLAGDSTMAKGGGGNGTDGTRLFLLDDASSDSFQVGVNTLPNI